MRKFQGFRADGLSGESGAIFQRFPAVRQRPSPRGRSTAVRTECGNTKMAPSQGGGSQSRFTRVPPGRRGSQMVRATTREPRSASAGVADDGCPWQQRSQSPRTFSTQRRQGAKAEDGCPWAAAVTIPGDIFNAKSPGREGVGSQGRAFPPESLRLCAFALNILRFLCLGFA